MFEDYLPFIAMQESGNRDYDEKNNPITSPVGAKYAMQVMPATAANPGFGIKPAASDTPEEYNRVGREYFGKMMERYNGDVKKALAAYNWGPGNVDKWDGDLNKLPAETRKYVTNITTNFEKAQKPKPKMENTNTTAPFGQFNAQDVEIVSALQNATGNQPAQPQTPQQVFSDVPQGTQQIRQQLTGNEIIANKQAIARPKMQEAYNQTFIAQGMRWVAEQFKPDVPPPPQGIHNQLKGPHTPVKPLSAEAVQSQDNPTLPLSAEEVQRQDNPAPSLSAEEAQLQDNPTPSTTEPVEPTQPATDSNVNEWGEEHSQLDLSPETLNTKAEAAAAQSTPVPGGRSNDGSWLGNFLSSVSGTDPKEYKDVGSWVSNNPAAALAVFRTGLEIFNWAKYDKTAITKIGTALGQHFEAQQRNLAARAKANEIKFVGEDRKVTDSNGRNPISIKRAERGGVNYFDASLPASMRDELVKKFPESADRIKGGLFTSDELRAAGYDVGKATNFGTGSLGKSEDGAVSVGTKKVPATVYGDGSAILKKPLMVTDAEGKEHTLPAGSNLTREELMKIGGSSSTSLPTVGQFVKSGEKLKEDVDLFERSIRSMEHATRELKGDPTVIGQKLRTVADDIKRLGWDAGITELSQLNQDKQAAIMVQARALFGANASNKDVERLMKLYSTAGISDPSKFMNLMVDGIIDEMEGIDRQVKIQSQDAELLERDLPVERDVVARSRPVVAKGISEALRKGWTPTETQVARLERQGFVIKRDGNNKVTGVTIDGMKSAEENKERVDRDLERVRKAAPTIR